MNKPCIFPKTQERMSNRAYPKNTNFETFVPRNLKFQTYGDNDATKKC